MSVWLQLFQTLVIFLHCLRVFCLSSGTFADEYRGKVFLCDKLHKRLKIGTVDGVLKGQVLFLSAFV